MTQSPEQAQSSQNSNDFTVTSQNIEIHEDGVAIPSLGEKLTANPVMGTGSFGISWNLPLPSITRITNKGIPLYRYTVSSDEFILSYAEDMLPEFV